MIALGAPRYSIDEVAAILKLGRSTVYARIKAGLLRVSKDGNRTFIEGAELQRYLTVCSAPAVPA